MYTYCKNNSNNFSDNSGEKAEVLEVANELKDFQTGTLSYGINLAGGGPISAGISVYYVSDTHGNWDIQCSKIIGGGFESIAPSVFRGSTSAATTHLLLGDGMSGGANLV